MAKKRKKTKLAEKLAGYRVPKPLLKTALNAAKTPLGRIIIAEALVLAAGVLVRKHPVAAVSAAGAGAAEATRSVASAASEAAVSLLHATADRLQAGTGLGAHAKDAGPAISKQDRPDRYKGRSAWDHLDQDTIRQALLGEFSRKKKSRKAKGAKRH